MFRRWKYERDGLSPSLHMYKILACHNSSLSQGYQKFGMESSCSNWKLFANTKFNSCVNYLPWKLAAELFFPAFLKEFRRKQLQHFFITSWSFYSWHFVLGDWQKQERWKSRTFYLEKRTSLTIEVTQNTLLGEIQGSRTFRKFEVPATFLESFARWIFGDAKNCSSSAI